MTQADITKYDSLENDTAKKTFAIEYFMRQRTLFEQRTVRPVSSLDVDALVQIAGSRPFYIETDTWKDVCRVCSKRGVMGDEIKWRKGPNLGWAHVACLTQVGL